MIPLSTFKIKRLYNHQKYVVEARLLVRELEVLEQAMRTQIAAHDQIEGWIDRRFIKAEEVEKAFPGYTETTARLKRTQNIRTDYECILQRYADYSAATSKGGAYRKNHTNNMSVAKNVIVWLEKTFHSYPT